MKSLLPYFRAIGIFVCLYTWSLSAQVAEVKTEEPFLDASVDSTIIAINNLSAKFMELEKRSFAFENYFTQFSNTLDSLENEQNENQKVTVSHVDIINEILSTSEFERNSEIDNICHTIVSTADFVKSANVSLNALILSNALTDYLNQIADLNSPNNTDLGFSITERVTEIVQQDVISHSKEQRKNKGKFLQIVKGIVANPLVQALTVPVSTMVNSLSNVSNTVTQVALSDEDIKAEHIEQFKNNLRKYVEHYQGLSNATAGFEERTSNINIRIIALQQLLYNFTNERITTLFPNQDIKDNNTSLTQLIRRHYDLRQVERQVSNIRKEYEATASLHEILADQRLHYPSYALNQSRMIYDEIAALYQEYLSSLKSYQTDIELVLNKSRNIGESDKIEQKIKDLQQLLSGVETALYDAVNVADVEKRFFGLIPQ